MLSYELTFWFISIENIGKQNSLNALRVVTINSVVINVIPRENILPFMKNEGLSYPTHLLKIGDSGIKNYPIEY